jgi:hypothetical protein
MMMDWHGSSEVARRMIDTPALDTLVARAFGAFAGRRRRKGNNQSS